MELPVLDGQTLAWAAFAFLCGALPFSVWLSSLAGNDVRKVGDKNPGATNALKASGWQTGLAALLLDISKAAAPVGLAYQFFGLRGPGMLCIALAPMLGHAYSPFLNFKGGKALATCLGVWIGLTIWDLPLVALAGITLWFMLLRNSGWAVLLTLIGMALFLVTVKQDMLLLQILGLQSILLIWKQREDLRKLPRLYRPKKTID